ncbi:hypothetical protein [Vibrio sp. CAU 1672]|uniref:hypothetical protein n=1 Tax=Vibrio sp. CAU 1672 TaxID=3032594 RepID=UPI0023DAEC52|nr:hypothetical protein [Vibrio sp. CAU 1672]MDF2152200.1 hypothetical protein [Vibrio sp. CAU 1672]
MRTIAIKYASVALALLVTLTGCQLTRVEGKVDDVNIKVSTEDDYHSGHGHFCPPGQAKKGNCD